MKQFFTILTILFITFFISTNVWGQLFDENFDYVTGTYLTANGWTAHSGSGSQPVQVTSPGLTYAGYPNSNIGEAATVIGGSGSREDVHHTFTSQNSGSVYAFFILNVHADTGTADYFFHLGPSPISTTFRGRVFLKDSAGNFAFGLSKGSTSNITYTGYNYSRNTTYLLGLRYTFNTGSTTDDAVSLWINPSLDGTQPAPNLTQTDASITDASNIGAVALRQGANYYDVTVDGIRIQATWLQPNFSVTPTSLDYSNLSVGSVHTDSVTVTNTGSVPLNITSVASDNPEFTVLPISALIPASSSANFYVTFSPISAGLKTRNIVFHHNGSTIMDTVTVSGTGLAPIFSVSPASLDFNNLFVGSIYQDTVTVTNTGNQTLNLTSVTSDNSEFTVSPSSGTIQATESEDFYITFSPTSTGFKTGNIVFSHDAQSVTDTVKVQGTGIAPGFSVTPTELNFGDLFINTIKIDTVTVSNNGLAVLNISSITSNNSAFIISPTSGTIPVSESRKFAVTFSPTSIGLKLGEIIFMHDAQSSPDTITVSGNGIDYITIGAARLRPNGDTVTIQGIITRALGAFTRIQDATGGLSVRQASGSFYDSLASGGIRPGDLVKMKGILSEYASLKQFNQADIRSFERISRDNPLPTPQLVTLSEIALHGEQYESELITIVDMSINPAGDVNFAAAKTYQISDTSDLTNAVALRTPNATDSDVDGTSIPTGPFTFTGVLGQFSFSDPATGYQILPVLVTDINLQVEVRESDPLPTVFALKGNYPNPFNPSTTINYQLPTQSHVTLKVFDVIGREVATLVNGVEEPGYKSVNFTASGLASGIYYYRLSAGNFVQTMKLVLMK